jgi:hypothetical protein
LFDLTETPIARRVRKNKAKRLRYLRVQARRLGRRFRPKRARSWHGRAWWETRRLEHAVLEGQGLPEEYAQFETVRIGNALVYRGEVELDPIGARRRIAIIFAGPPSTTRPVVMASGPRRSRHRFRTYRPTSLCIWYARDDPAMQWRLQDGLPVLIDLARVHLIREAWWRETGRWDGPEVHRDPNLKVDQSPTARKRYERRKCWCGSGRQYMRCHGSIAAEQELAILGIGDEGTTITDARAA